MAINKRGYEIVSEEEYYNRIMGKLKEHFPTMSENPGNLLTVLARVLARNENARDYDRVEAYSNAYVATATGLALDKAVRTAGVSRIKGTSSVGTVEITKDPEINQIIIPKNMAIKSNDLIYQTINTNAIIMNSDKLEVQIVSSDVGSEYDMPDGAKFKTVLSIRGVDSIVAKGVVSGGTDVESDLALRERYYKRMNAHANSSLRGVMDAVLSIPEVTAVAGDENVLDTTSGGLLPHSFIVYVNGGDNQTIAETIMTTKPAGVQTNGSIEVGVQISGKEHKIRFSRFQEQRIYFYLDVAIDRSIAPPNLIDEIKDVLIAHVNGSKTLVSYEITNEVSQAVEAVKGVKNVFFGTDPNPSTNTDISAPSGYAFITAKEDIEVVVI